ncbi:aspartyl protease family protein [Sphingomonas nostoxanthinifaciens]|uniref:aspartyl protease family protein n=1 Tax=Sphingomonas nostoxanthinifaciens TaxID=2872652 RepID=UPI001CC1D8D7|nr:aspartyl protease family protein [Sphingomonas nostoxanthinifaciens]UAK24907.1 aspartyl protease family protein [Sphingomonas nostoxanthinifaciens]
MKRIVMASALAMASAAAAPVGAVCTRGLKAELPITFNGLRPMVPTKVNGFDKTFLLDSGAFWSTITHEDAAKFGMKLSAQGKGYEIIGIGGSENTGIAAAQTLTLSGRTIAASGSYPGFLQFLLGSGSVLGQNILNSGDTEYDLGQGVVRLIQATGCDADQSPYWARNGTAYSVIGIEPVERNWHIRGQVIVNGVTMKAIFDTGASTSVLSLPAAARVGVKPSSPGVVPAGLAHGFGARSRDTWIGPFASFKVGDEEIRNTRLRIGDLGGDIDVDMLLGADFFLSHHVYVSKSQHKLYFTYNGGPVFNLSVQDGAAPAPSTANQPKLADAESYARRASASVARGDRADALADMAQAIALAPNESRYLLGRAAMYREGGNLALARKDLDAALAIDPKNVEALLASARMRVGADKPALARRDLDALASILPADADEQRFLGGLYGDIDAFEPGIAHLTLWLDAHRQSGLRAALLNERCWLRGLAGRELAEGLADCNEALRGNAKDGAMLDSRGLIRLRQGDLAGAKADYDAALKLDPKLAASLYGHGLVELRQGQKAAGDKDIAAGIAIDPKGIDRLKRNGIAA